MTEVGDHLGILSLRHAGWLVWFCCHGEISRTVRPPVVCLVPSESPWQGGVHACTGFVLWRLDLQGKSYGFSKKLRVIKIRKLLYILVVATAKGTLVRLKVGGS